MKHIKRCLVVMFAVVMTLNALVGCGTAEPVKTPINETQATQQQTSEPTEETTEEVTENKKDTMSIAVYNPKSNFGITTSAEDCENSIQYLDISNNTLKRQSGTVFLTDLFFIGSTYSANITEDVVAKDEITFVGESEQGKDTKYSIKNNHTTVSFIAEKSANATLSLQKREAKTTSANGYIEYEVIDIKEGGKAYILKITATTTDISGVEISYNESLRQYTVTSTSPIKDVDATFEGFSENEGTGAITTEEGTKFTITIENDNMIEIKKVK